MKTTALAAVAALAFGATTAFAGPEPVKAFEDIAGAGIDGTQAAAAGAGHASTLIDDATGSAPLAALGGLVTGIIYFPVGVAVSGGEGVMDLIGIGDGEGPVEDANPFE